MKTIEEFTLENMVIIEKYLNNQMTEKEKTKFLAQLKQDKELKEDFELAKTSLAKNRSMSNFSNTKRQRSLFDLPVFSINRKRNLGKSLTQDGLLYIVIASLMLVICIIILYIMA